MPHPRCCPLFDKERPRFGYAALMSLILLGLSSGLCWGTADFFGGLQSRRLPALSVALWSQLAGALVLMAVLFLSRQRPTLDGVLWGMVSGACSGSALVLFYRGLAEGVMSVVAPVSACGALVPVAFDLAGGHVPGPITSAGVVVAITGIVLISLHAGEPAPSSISHRPRQTLLLALGSALGFGLFYVFLNRGSTVAGGTPLWSVGGARMGSLTILVLLTLRDRRGVTWPGVRAPAVAGVGILDTTANALFAFAATQGALGVASVLGSLYPAATVGLGRVVLAEKLTRMQGVGVACALAGVALLSTAG